jgi:CRISPR associated protein Cas1
MPSACIIQPRCRVSLKGERLEVFGHSEVTDRDEVLREIPIRDLDRLILGESVQLPSPALAALLRANIPVNLLAWNGQFLGGFLPAQNDHGQARLRQYRQTLDPAFGLQMAGRIVTAKIYNQRRVLQRLAASRKADSELRIADCGLQIENAQAPGSAQPAAAHSAACNCQPPIPAPQSAMRNDQSAIGNLPSSIPQIDEEEDRVVAYKIDARCAKETLTAGRMVCSEKAVCYLV